MSENVSPSLAPSSGTYFRSLAFLRCRRHRGISELEVVTNPTISLIAMRFPGRRGGQHEACDAKHKNEQRCHDHARADVHYDLQLRETRKATTVAYRILKAFVR